MNSQCFNYSLKNIPIPDNTSYKLLLIEKIESFIKRIRWKAFFFLKGSEKETNENNNISATQNNTDNNFGFKTKNTPPQCVELEKFEDDLLNLARNLQFKNTHSQFQNQLKSDVSRIKNDPNVLVFADKTNNMYQFSKSDHEKLLNENITKTYKKAPPKLEHSINLKAKNISKKLNLEDLVECIAKTEAFITLKDHKENFQNKLPCRLIVPSKSELGHVSKTHLDRINSEIRQKLKLNQWKNTTDVITWFSKIDKNKNVLLSNWILRNFTPL